MKQSKEDGVSNKEENKRNEHSFIPKIIAVHLALVRRLNDSLSLVTQQFYRVLLRNTVVHFTLNKCKKAGF